MDILVDQPNSAAPAQAPKPDENAKPNVTAQKSLPHLALRPLEPINLMLATRTARRRLGTSGPTPIAGARRSRAYAPSAQEALLDESAPPITALPGGAESAPRRQRERAVFREDRRRVGDLAFTRAADAAAVLAAPLTAGYVARSVGLFVAGAGLIALARGRARGMALGERAINAITPLIAVLTIGAVESADALLTPDTGGADVVTATLIALLIGAGVALGTTLFSRAFVRTRVAVIGSLASAHELAWELSSDGNRRYTVVGFVTPPGDRDSAHDLRHISFRVRPLGELAELDAIVDDNDIDMLVLAQGNDRLEVFERAAGCAERRRTRLVGLGTFNENVFQRVSIEELNSAWLQHMMHPRYRPAPATLIRLLDVAGALALSVLTAPLWMLAALAVRVEDGGPVLYRQRRVGEGGRHFTIIKFRSMRTDAEAAGPRWSSGDDDERVTRVGRVIRRFHIDELPQLINVLRGDMSLVGPRPERPEFVHRLEQDICFYGRRHLIKPGVTGWAQVRAGYGMSEDGQAVKLSRDLFYLKQQSVLLYLYVLAATAFTVVAGTVHSRAH